MLNGDERGEGGGAEGSTKGKNEINDKRDAGLTNKQINTWEGPIGKWDNCATRGPSGLFLSLSLPFSLSLSLSLSLFPLLLLRSVCPSWVRLYRFNVDSSNCLSLSLSLSLSSFICFAWASRATRRSGEACYRWMGPIDGSIYRSPRYASAYPSPQPSLRLFTRFSRPSYLVAIEIIGEHRQPRASSNTL